MSTSQVQEIRGALLMRGHTYASVAAQLGCSRTHVHYVVHGRTTSARVRAAIVEILGRDPWANEFKAPPPLMSGGAA